MQVVEKAGEGLSRSFGVTIPVGELTAALEERITEILPTLNLKGFRPGKVPPGHVKRLYGKSLMSEIVEKKLGEGSQKVLADNGLRVASQPDLQPACDMEEVLAGRVDLAFELNVEVMPDFDPIDLSGLTLERPVFTTTEADLDAAVAEVAAQNRTYTDREGDDAAAQDGDQVVIDFIGRIDGEAFQGGTAEGAELVLGSGQFIPGFEEQLVGAKIGESRDVKVTFPEDYQAENLKGKDAVFEVAVKGVRAPQESAVDDELAKRLGLEDLEALRNAVRENLDRPFVAASRFRLKRALLDVLDAGHEAIPLPPRMVTAEFDSIWAQLERDKADGQLSPEDASKSDEDLQAEYRKIAERRVRLGLVLAEIGRRENVQVTDAELGDAMRAEAMRYGQQAQEVFDLLRRNPDIQAQLRAPIYEEKVVDLIVGRAQVTDKPVSREFLMSDDDVEAPAVEAAADEAPAKPKRASKPKAKADAEAPSEEAAPAEAATAEDKPAKPKRASKAKAKAEDSAPE